MYHATGLRDVTFWRAAMSIYYVSVSTLGSSSADEEEFSCSSKFPSNLSRTLKSRTLKSRTQFVVITTSYIKYMLYDY